MINKKIESYFDSTKTLQNKIANIECISVMILLIGNIIIFSILDINKLLIYFTIGVLICLIIIFFLANKTKKIHIYSLLGFIISNMALLSYSLATEIQISTYLYFIVGIIFAILLYRDNFRKIIIIIEIVLYITIIFITSKFNSFYEKKIDEIPIINIESTVEEKDKFHFLLTINDLFFATFSLGLSISTVLKMYENQAKKLNKMNKYLNTLSLTDPLTGLWNRKYLDDWIKNTDINKYEDISAILFDIDYFKRVNDTYGHQEGDNILKKISKLLQDTIDKAHIPIRYGGEEFLIILPNTSIDETYNIAQKIRKKVSQKIKISRSNNNITISGGVSSLQKSKSVKRLIKKADLNLYSAKASGRNKIVK